MVCLFVSVCIRRREAERGGCLIFVPIHCSLSACPPHRCGAVFGEKVGNTGVGARARVHSSTQTVRGEGGRQCPFLNLDGVGLGWLDWVCGVGLFV